MTLDSFITKHGMTEAEIASKAGCSQSTINKVRNGVGNPTFDLLMRISRATGGKFQVSDFVKKERSPVTGDAA
jgi:transcriptional regulator with XRE-family HTH domain